jgi:hypothetical protein
MGNNQGDLNSIKIPQAIIDSGLLARMKPSEIKVYLVIAKCAHHKHDRAFPSIAQICEFSGINKNAVCQAIKRLEYFGVIKKYRAPKGFKFHNVYRVLKVPIINPLVIPQKVKKASTRSRGKDGKWVVTPKDVIDNTFPQNMETDILPQNMERKKSEIKINGNKLNNIKQIEARGK